MRHLLLAALLVAMTGCGPDTKPPAETSANSIGMRFVPIPAGTFTMGDADNGPTHKVTLTKPFELGLKQAKVESRIVIRVRAAAIGWQVSARALFEFCVAA